MEQQDSETEVDWNNPEVVMAARQWIAMRMKEKSHTDLLDALRGGIDAAPANEALARLLETAERDHALLAGEIMPLRVLLGKCHAVMVDFLDQDKESSALFPEFLSVMQEVRAALRAS